MTNNNPNQTPDKAEAQDAPDAWAYDALGEKPPQISGSTLASNQNGQNQRGVGNQADNGSSGGDKDPKPGDGKQPAANAEDQTPDPLSALDLSALLKHPVLGPQLNQWNDRTTNSRLSSERSKIRTELEPQVRRDVEYQEVKEYLTGMSDEERGQALARDPALARTWANIQTAEEQITASPEVVAQQAQVYAIATILSSHHAMILGSDLPDEVKAKLSDTSEYEADGDEGVRNWVQSVNTALREHAITAEVQQQLETKWESYKLDKEASTGSRPGLSPTGRQQAPVPEMDSPDSREFLSAFH